MFDVVTATSHEPVDTGDALVFPYPAGTVAADFTSDGHKASSRGLMAKLALDDGDFTLSFGASFVTMTYFGTTSIPPGTVVRLELHRKRFTVASTGAVADRVLYTTATDTWSDTPLTPFGRSLIDDADAAAALETLGVVALTPQMFGAVGDGVTDDTAALNEAFAQIREQVHADTLSRFWWLDGNGKRYRIDGSVNATEIRNRRNWGIRNLTIEAHCTGKVALDFLGSSEGQIENVYVWGDETDRPRTGIQLARAQINGSTGVPAHQWLVVNVQTDGYFDYAGFHSYANEVCTYVLPNFQNRASPSGANEAWAAIFDGAGTKTVASEFLHDNGAGRSLALETGAHSFKDTTILGGEMAKLVSATGSPVYIERAQQFKMLGTYLVSFDDAAITLGINDATSCRLMEFDVDVETTGVQSIVKFTGATAAARTLRGLNIRCNQPHTATQLFQIDTLTGMTIHDFKLHVGHWNGGTAPTAGVFDVAASYTLRNADISVPTLAGMNNRNTFAAFTGKLYAQDNNTTRYYGETRQQMYVAGTVQTLICKDDSVSGGRTDRDRDSATPASNNILWSDRTLGRDSGGNSTLYTHREHILVSPTDGSEQGRIRDKVIIGGVETEVSRQDANGFHVRAGALMIPDGMTAPAAMVGYAKIYVDAADGDLKVIFADGIVKTIMTDT